MLWAISRHDIPARKCLDGLKNWNHFSRDCLSQYNFDWLRLRESHFKLNKAVSLGHKRNVFKETPASFCWSDPCRQNLLLALSWTIGLTSDHWNDWINILKINGQQYINWIHSGRIIPFCYGDGNNWGLVTKDLSACWKSFCLNLHWGLVVLLKYTAFGVFPDMKDHN